MEVVMKEENTKTLESLAKTSYRSGILPIFLGLLIGFVGVISFEELAAVLVNCR